MKTLLFAAMLVAASACSTSHYDGMNSSAPAAITSIGAPDIAGIVTTANDGEIKLAQSALPHLSSSAARDFANMMIADHTAALNETNATLAAAHIVARNTSGQVAMLRDDTARLVTTLNNSGNSGDHVYMQSQIEAHQRLLTMLDNQLIPSANGDLLNALQKQRMTVAMHLDHARQIAAALP
jgi:putative membrane protein